MWDSNPPDILGANETTTASSPNPHNCQRTKKPSKPKFLRACRERCVPPFRYQQAPDYLGRWLRTVGIQNSSCLYNYTKNQNVKSFFLYLWK